MYFKKCYILYLIDLFTPYFHTKSGTLARVRLARGVTKNIFDVAQPLPRVFLGRIKEMKVPVHYWTLSAGTPLPSWVSLS